VNVPIWDFGTALVILSLISGVLWAVDQLILARRRQARLIVSGLAAESEAGQEALYPPVWADYARSFFPVFVIVLLLRSFLLEPFRIPSGSMMPTLLIGDFILVNKYQYGIRVPITNHKILPVGAPERGDVVVFRYPEEPSQSFIKRVVGLPGDRVRYRDKTLFINDLPMHQVGGEPYFGVGQGAPYTGSLQRTEDLVGLRHEILQIPEKPSELVELTVPPDQYFVLGDNRDNSRDSRYWGMVPEGNLIGKAIFIWMNFDLKGGGVDFHRIGGAIK